MSNNKINSTELLIGALIGGLVVGTTAVLLSSKVEKLKGDIPDRYRDLKDKMDDFIDSLSDNTQAIANNVSGHASEWTDKAKDAAEYIKDELAALAGPGHRDLKIGLVAGGILAGIVGIGAIFALSGRGQRKRNVDFLSQFSDKAVAFKKILQNVQQVINGSTNKGSWQALQSKASHPINDIVDFALTGVQLWHSFKNRK